MNNLRTAAEIADKRQYFGRLWWRALNGDPQAREEVAADADGSVPVTESYVCSPRFEEDMEELRAWRDTFRGADEAGANELAGYVAGMFEQMRGRAERMKMGLDPVTPDPPFYGPPSSRAEVRELWRWHKTHGVPPASMGPKDRAAVARWRDMQAAVNGLIIDCGGRPPE